MENGTGMDGNSQASKAELTTHNTKLIVVILLLILVYPAGVIMMWQWMKYWAWWLKLILTLPAIAGIIGATLFLVMTLDDPNKIIEKAQNTTSHSTAEEFVNATERYVIKKNEFPCKLPSLAPGLPLSQLGNCMQELILTDELDSSFPSSPALGIINVHYDEVESTLFACIENGCISKVMAGSEFINPNIDLQLPTPTPSGPPPLFGE